MSPSRQVKWRLRGSWYDPSPVCLGEIKLQTGNNPLCANIAETTASSLITVEGEEKTDVKRYEKQRSPRS